jgi:aerobic C4-dicarboxylate transport protein
MFHAGILQRAAHLPELMITVALVVSLLLAYLFGPCHGMDIDPSTLDARIVTGPAQVLNQNLLQRSGG